MKNRIQYLPGIVLLVIGGLPLVTQLSAPERFMAGQPPAGAAGSGSLEAEVARLRQRVAALESQLATVRANSALALDGHVEVLPDRGEMATVRFSGVNLQVVNRRGVALDTSSGEP